MKYGSLDEKERKAIARMAAAYKANKRNITAVEVAEFMDDAARDVGPLMERLAYHEFVRKPFSNQFTPESFEIQPQIMEFAHELEQLEKAERNRDLVEEWITWAKQKRPVAVVVVAAIVVGALITFANQAVELVEKLIPDKPPVQVAPPSAPKPKQIPKRKKTAPKKLPSKKSTTPTRKERNHDTQTTWQRRREHFRAVRRLLGRQHRHRLQRGRQDASRTVYGKTKREVQEKMTRLQTSKHDGTLAQPSKTMLAEHEARQVIAGLHLSSKRRAWESNPQPVSRHLISSCGRRCSPLSTVRFTAVFASGTIQVF